ncbi:PA2778 family cysteine peptidase [Lentisalinibacter sediminis]|uniref:PA2778 family cysteine peptidase n=1 Tax=Lentisalinibacter sediminis TaxID=2992237 RepID=UPI00387027E2
MRAKSQIILILAAITQLMLSACAVGPERQVLREAGSPVEVFRVPFFPQDEYQCGPAALATVLNHSGVDVTPAQLVSHVYVPERRGSLQAEMLAAARTHGRVPYVLPQSLAPILAELRAGHPVLLLQNLGLDRWPVWHYAVLIGFDPAAEKLLLRSGITRRAETGAVPFLTSWDRGGRWAMIAVEAGEPPASADVLGWLRAVAPFESTGHLELAAEGYTAAVARWPGEAMAWTALGNVRYLQRDLAAAASAYRHALELEPDFRTARNNLAQTLAELANAGDGARQETNAGSMESAGSP